MKTICRWCLWLALPLTAWGTDKLELDVQQKTVAVKPLSAAELQDLQAQRQASAADEAHWAADRLDLTKQDERFRAAVQAIVVVVNRRLPADKAITVQEVAQEFKAALQAQSAP